MCGCNKGKMARPVGATPTVSPQTRQTSSARVIAPASPYMSKQNTAPAHLQASLRKVV